MSPEVCFHVDPEISTFHCKPEVLQELVDLQYLFDSFLNIHTCSVLVMFPFCRKGSMLQLKYNLMRYAYTYNRFILS